MRKIETLKQAGYRLVGRPRPGVVELEDIETGKREFWGAHQYSASYTVKVGRWTYEFISSLHA